MDPQNSFAEIDKKLRAGDQDAANDVVNRFVRQLCSLAHEKLDARILRKEDPEEVIQSVYRSFFTRHRDGKFELATWDSLWSLLARITVRKCQNRNEHYRAKRRDIDREVPAADREDAATDVREALDREPTSEEASILLETVEEMMRGFETDARAIIELRLQGFTNQEISEQVGVSERTVTRVLDRGKERLLRMQAADIQST